MSGEKQLVHETTTIESLLLGDRQRLHATAQLRQITKFLVHNPESGYKFGEQTLRMIDAVMQQLDRDEVSKPEDRAFPDAALTLAVLSIISKSDAIFGHFEAQSKNGISRLPPNELELLRKDMQERRAIVLFYRSKWDRQVPEIAAAVESMLTPPEKIE